MTNNNDQDRRLGAAVREARARLRMSQTRLASLMREHGASHWHQNTVSRVEQGAQPVRPDELGPLQAVLGMQVDGTDCPVCGASRASELSAVAFAAELRMLREAVADSLARVDAMLAKAIIDGQEDDEPNGGRDAWVAALRKHQPTTIAPHLDGQED